MIFFKLNGLGNDFVITDDRENKYTENLDEMARKLCHRRTGIGADGLVFVRNSETCDVRMQIFNSDGSEGKMAGNSIRCVGKYLYDNGFASKKHISIETASGIKQLQLFLYGGSVRSVTVDMGKVSLRSKDIPVLLGSETVIDKSVQIAGRDYRISCVSVGNPHCVVFCERLDNIDIEEIGPKFENAEIFPERINTEFVRVVDNRTLRMRVWERGNGETPACGTGACAAVVAAVENGYCLKNEDITVRVNGGELTVRYTDETVFLTGNAVKVFEGFIEY